MNAPRRFLAGLSPNQFLAQHWQKKPLLCRGAVPNYTPPLSPDELAGLACETEVESRLVQRTATRYSLEVGPFPEARFHTLGKKNWTLLVQDLDQHVPAVLSLLDHLDFLPSWRVDDVMASFAADGGSVGPHYDEYDVFLLQVEGKRRWQVSELFSRDDLVKNSQLKLLRNFSPQAEWVLEPGDMLYLPPHVAHFGVAEGPCVTYSLGCRAPSVSQLVEHFAQRASSQSDEGQRYQDPDLTPTSGRFSLDAAALARTRSILNQALTFDDETLGRGLGTLATQPKALFARDAIRPLTSARAEKRLAQKRGLQRRIGSRWNHFVADKRRAYLFVDGTEFAFAGKRDFLQELCSQASLSATWIQDRQNNKVEKQLLLDLVRFGYLE